MNNRIVPMLVVVLAVAGCGKSKESGSAGDGGATASAPVVAAPEAVAAVLQSSGPPLAKLGFVVAAKPVIGTQTGLRLEVTSADPAVLVAMAEGDGVVVDTATARASLTWVTGGTTVSHELKITPQREGLTQVIVRLRTGEAESAETVYAIPVLAARAGG